MDGLRELLATMTPDEFKAASRKRELEEWKATNKFCGKCGAKMQPHTNPQERALVCPKCGYMAYPKICPAVIVLVTRGDKILLQRNTHYKLKNWTLVAGFVDAGENFEDAVRREVRVWSAEVNAPDQVRLLMRTVWNTRGLYLSDRYLFYDNFPREVRCV